MPCYTTLEIQNELLQIIASIVRENICTAVKIVGVHSVLADETKDCSKQEQLAVVVIYVDQETAVQCKHFITYVQATSFNAQSLSTYILDTLKKNGLDPTAIVSQTAYDGGSLMSGKCSNVQHIKELASEAMYIHCYAHCLNLALINTTKHNYFRCCILLCFNGNTLSVHIISKSTCSLHPPAISVIS